MTTDHDNMSAVRIVCLSMRATTRARLSLLHRLILSLSLVAYHKPSTSALSVQYMRGISDSKCEVNENLLFVLKCTLYSFDLYWVDMSRFFNRNKRYNLLRSHSNGPNNLSGNDISRVKMFMRFVLFFKLHIIYDY